MQSDISAKLMASARHSLSLFARACTALHCGHASISSAQQQQQQVRPCACARELTKSEKKNTHTSPGTIESGRLQWCTTLHATIVENMLQRDFMKIEMIVDLNGSQNSVYTYSQSGAKRIVYILYPIQLHPGLYTLA